MCESQKCNGLIWKWSTHTRLRHYLPIPSQYRGGGPQVKGMRGFGLAIGRRGAYFGVPAQALLGEMSCWDDNSSKRGKRELESLDTCYKGW